MATTSATTTMENNTTQFEWNDKLTFCVEHETHTDQLIRPKDTWDKFPIGKWIRSQVKFYKQGNLSAEKLESLALLRTWQKLTEKVIVKNQEERKRRAWDEMFQLCTQFEQDSDEPIRTRDEVNNVNIGRWLNRQKSVYNKGKMTEEQLQTLGQLRTWVTWKEQRDDKPRYTWNEKLALCAEFEQLHDPDRLIEYQDVHGQMAIGKWLSNMKGAYKRNKVKDEQLENLRQLATWRRFEETFQPRE